MKKYSKIVLKKQMKKHSTKRLPLILISLFILGLIGEFKCIYKAFNCNWEPIGKAEVVYTASSLTGLGMIVGWFDIVDK